MPLKSRNHMVYWILFVGLFVWIFWNFSLMPVDFKARPMITEMAHAEEIARVEIIDDSVTVDTRPADTISFTKKAACQHNVQTINTMVELWYIQHGGNWPKEDFSDIGHDVDYFPRGISKCPLDGGQYRLDPITHWVQGHDHGDVKNPFMNEPVFSK